jgi:hypothetical protein
MSEEVYDNLSAKEIAKILKEKIESRKEFSVTFTSDIYIYVAISYIAKIRGFVLTVSKSIFDKPVEEAEVNIRIPDQFIHGDGTIGITPEGISCLTSAYGKTIMVYRKEIAKGVGLTAIHLWGK